MKPCAVKLDRPVGFRPGTRNPVLTDKYVQCCARNSDNFSASSKSTDRQRKSLASEPTREGLADRIRDGGVRRGIGDAARERRAQVVAAGERQTPVQRLPGNCAKYVLHRASGAQRGAVALGRLVAHLSAHPVELLLADHNTADDVDADSAVEADADIVRDEVVAEDAGGLGGGEGTADVKQDREHLGPWTRRTPRRKRDAVLGRHEPRDAIYAQPAIHAQAVDRPDRRVIEGLEHPDEAQGFFREADGAVCIEHIEHAQRDAAGIAISEVFSVPVAGTEARADGVMIANGIAGSGPAPLVVVLVGHFATLSHAPPRTPTSGDHSRKLPEHDDKIVETALKRFKAGIWARG